MRLLVLAVLILVVLLAIWAATRIAARSRQRAVHEGWRLAREEEGARSVFLLRRGETVHRVGAADRTDADYDDQLIALQSEAEDLALRWNAAEKSISG